MLKRVVILRRDGIETIVSFPVYFQVLDMEKIIGFELSFIKHMKNGELYLRQGDAIC